MFEISVVIPAYNNVHSTINCINSLLKQTIDNSLFEIIVVNNNSTDDTKELVSKLISNVDNCKLVDELNQGVSFARNKGWKEASAEIIVFIDNDVTADEGLLVKMLNSFISIKPAPVAVGPQIRPNYETSPPNWFVDDFEIRGWGGAARFLNKHEEQQGFAGGCFAVKKTSLERVQGFDTNIGVIGDDIGAGEEPDFFYRLQKSHNNSESLWYDPTVVVYHFVPEQHSTLKYKFKRALAFGSSTRMASKGKRNKLKYMVGLFIPFTSLFLEVIKLTYKKKYPKLSTNLVVVMCEFMWKIGYYWTIEKSS
ncbi:MAG: glycosyltransferase family 2 protein [Colwellia sp.]|nr:glycosyltransferase family 2 protein [Colwellia sp.]